MGRYIEQNQGRSELQQRIAADLRAKADARAKDEGKGGVGYADDDSIDNAEYLKGTKATTTLAPAWAAIFIVSVIVFVIFIYQMNR